MTAARARHFYTVRIAATQAPPAAARSTSSLRAADHARSRGSSLLLFLALAAAMALGTTAGVDGPFQAGLLMLIAGSVLLTLRS